MATLDLSDDELQDAAQAARVACHQARQDAAKQANIRAAFDSTARKFCELAQKFEAARPRDEPRARHPHVFKK
jgi:hypothetical protein